MLGLLPGAGAGSW